MKLALSLLSVFSLAFLVFTTTPIGDSVAAAVAAQNPLYKHCLALIATEHDIENRTDSFSVTVADFTNDDTNDYIVKITTPHTCGTTGCVHELCRVEGERVIFTPFGFATESITVLTNHTQGYRDLGLSNDMELVWSGERYTVIE